MTSALSVNGSGPSSKIVLGVDDAPENVLLLQAVVKSGGYTFVAAKNGAECLTLIHRIIPRLILLDIQMPDMDGFETCRRLRANPTLRHIPIAFLTALKSAADVTTGLAAGGNDFIVKPFDPAKLLARVKHWTGRSVDSAAAQK
jgi:CheY-like chemotaxis protein